MVHFCGVGCGVDKVNGIQLLQVDVTTQPLHALAVVVAMASCNCIKSLIHVHFLFFVAEQIFCLLEIAIH